MANKDVSIDDVLSYWIVNDLLIPNDLPKRTKGITPFEEKLAKINNYSNINKFMDCLPRKLSITYDIESAFSQNNKDVLKNINKEKQIVALKKQIVKHFCIDDNSEEENAKKIRELYSVSDSNYDICIGEVYTDALYTYFYELMQEEDIRVEKSSGKCYLFGMRISKDGTYIEGSYNLSSFVWGIAKCCENKSVNWLSQNSKEYENDKEKVDECLKEFSEEQPENVNGLIELAVSKTLTLVSAVNINDIISDKHSKAFYSFYKNTKILKKEQENRIYQSELNQSYFLQDMRMLQNKNLTASKLSKYILYNSNEVSKTDIRNNNSKLGEILHIKNFPLGKWPSKYDLTLMQQVAVNLSRKYLDENHPIFSVNGPPGTGKTTLLKEIIVDRIVERACLLLEYENADDAFTRCELSKEYDKYTKYYYKPHESLIPYGILVASSNNAAVENITKELPIAKDVCTQKAMTELFDIEKCENILQYKVASDKSEKHKDIFFTKWANQLNKEENINCWGLISAPLGKQANIKKYYDNVLCDLVFNKISVDNPKEFFDTAKQEFKEQLQKVQKIQKNFINENNTIDAPLRLKKIAREMNEVSQHIDALCAEENEYQIQLTETKKAIDKQSKKLQQYPTGFLGRLSEVFDSFLNPQRYKEYKELQDKVNSLKNKCINIETTLQNTQKNIFEEQKKKDILIHKNQTLKKEFKRYFLEKEGSYYKDGFESRILDIIGSDISDDNVQKNNAWINKEYNEEREKLFYCALNLQKAFVITSDKLRSNIGLLSKVWGFNTREDGSRYAFNKSDKEHTMVHLINTLFLITPVISSTFASIQSMLKDVTEENSLGLLIVDEAGQASPHMMLGSYFRAQTAIVVGDPKQIEPVVTTPDPIRRSFEGVDAYMSKILSVQNFADALNPFGTYLKNNTTYENEWVGCPLTVHRRCIEPMFGISNKLSYDNIMVNSTLEPENKKFCIKKSTWYDISGKEVGNKNHFVQEQANIVFKLIYDYYEQNKHLPEVYIITPFTTVKNGLYENLQKLGKNQIPGFDIFLDNAIGTVHTFQGKGTNEVFFVLGCDQNSLGAVKWVNANIVNVAVTRAKYRVCIVGDKQLWTTHSTIFEMVAKQLLND